MNSLAIRTSCLMLLLVTSSGVNAGHPGKGSGGHAGHCNTHATAKFNHGLNHYPHYPHAKLNYWYTNYPYSNPYWVRPQQSVVVSPIHVNNVSVPTVVAPIVPPAAAASTTGRVAVLATAPQEVVSVPVDSIIRLSGQSLGSEQGIVVLKIGKSTRKLEILQWDAEANEVVVQIPKLSTRKILQGAILIFSEPRNVDSVIAVNLIASV